MQNQLSFVPAKDESAIDKLSDADLVALCKDQLPDEIEGYHELVKRYEGLVYNFCLKTIGSPQDAEEVAQDALITVYHKVKQFEGKSAFKTWLYKIVHNCCCTRISKLARKRRAHEAYKDQVHKEQPPSAPANPQKQESKARIQDALNLLKPQEKEIITYKFILGLTLQEIAETLGSGESAAKMRYYRAMESFKSAYDRTGSDVPTPNLQSP